LDLGEKLYRGGRTGRRDRISHERGEGGRGVEGIGRRGKAEAFAMEEEQAT
jgi:hypothetical protein